MTGCLILSTSCLSLARNWAARRLRSSCISSLPTPGAGATIGVWRDGFFAGSLRDGAEDDGAAAAGAAAGNRPTTGPSESNVLSIEIQHWEATIIERSGNPSKHSAILRSIAHRYLSFNCQQP